MKLTELLQNYPAISVATEADNKEITRFFNNICMDTKSFSLRYDRGEDFFAFSKEQAEKYFIFIIRDESNLIQGTASISFIPHFIHGNDELCAYLGDLRVSRTLNLEIRLQWKKFYLDILNHFVQIEEFKNSKYLYTAILEENERAMRSLIKNNDQIIYHELSTYQTFNIYKEKFFTKVNNPYGYSVTRSTLQSCKEFLIKNNSSETMGHHYTSSDNDVILHRLKTWHAFSEASFLCVSDAHGKIIAVTAPWMTIQKKLVIEKMTLFFKILGRIIPFFGVPPILEGRPINILNLTHLQFEKNLTPEQIQTAMALLLQFILKNRKRDFHLISFFSYPQWKIQHLPFYKEIVKGKLYQVMSKEQFQQKQMIKLKESPPAFEIGIA